MERKIKRKFSREYKLEALRLSKERGLTAASESLGVGVNLLCNWRKKLKELGEESFGEAGRAETLEDENRRLRRENADLKEEKEILKKAAAYFAKHSR